MGVEEPASQEIRQRHLPEGQPNYGLTQSEHYDQYGWADEAGNYGQYGYYDGGEYARGTYGNPWGDANYYRNQGGGGGSRRGGSSSSRNNNGNNNNAYRYNNNGRGNNYNNSYNYN